MGRPPSVDVPARLTPAHPGSSVRPPRPYCRRVSAPRHRDGIPGGGGRLAYFPETGLPRLLPEQHGSPPAQCACSTSSGKNLGESRLSGAELRVASSTPTIRRARPRVAQQAARPTSCVPAQVSYRPARGNQVPATAYRQVPWRPFSAGRRRAGSPTPLPCPPASTSERPCRRAWAFHPRAPSPAAYFPSAHAAVAGPFRGPLTRQTSHPIHRLSSHHQSSPSFETLATARHLVRPSPPNHVQLCVVEAGFLSRYGRGPPPTVSSLASTRVPRLRGVRTFTCCR